MAKYVLNLNFKEILVQVNKAVYDYTYLTFWHRAIVGHEMERSAYTIIDGEDFQDDERSNDSGVSGEEQQDSERQPIMSLSHPDS